MTLLASARPHPAGYLEATVADVSLPPRGFRIVDVREPHEFTGELGHIAGAALVPLAGVLAHAQTWDKTETILLVCKSGGRSGQAAQALSRAGFGQVVNLVGGMMAWNAAGRPVEK
jgi:rhodanese-related sulfurtransferase